ncbi:DUF883 family protein [Wenzhouxiangella sp. XN79A]|uniref:DUF883 family protein n=1 Tax=Wenzhouxiangella sp. XN79A TaxID=2724193 RepID=UPI00144AEDBC|nr:DUF883 family protein [Wenzhouxiangella sp. XN79A]NKI34440.1 DUF883 family protein [Wenzhouxiangella sp. XN79A]
MASATEKELQELKAEFATLKDELASIGETVGRIAHSASDEGRQRVRSAANRSREQARETWGAFEKEVEDRPMTSIAAALGIGFMLGKLLDR